MSAIDRAVANSLYAHLGNSHVPPEPRLRLAVLTCMDARIDAFKLLGLQPGDAHVVRNAGGRVTEDVIRSLALSQAQLGTEEVLVLHHTECALSRCSEEDLVESVHKAAGARPSFAMLSFADDEQAVREDVAQLRASPFLAHSDSIRGFLYDIERGRLSEVGG